MQLLQLGCAPAVLYGHLWLLAFFCPLEKFFNVLTTEALSKKCAQ